MVPALWGHASSGRTKAYEHEISNQMPMSQEEFQYTDEVLARLEKYLSPERLAAYYGLARGDKWVAIRLYERNTELSEALYGVIQGLEVALRNAIHNVMTTRAGSPAWYDSIPFEEDEREAIGEAKRKIAERPAPVTPGRVIADLTFGFWVKLFTGSYEKSLWVPTLRKIFPLMVGRKLLHGRLVELKTLRNRIAHHERIVERDLLKDYASIIETIGWLSPDVQRWVSATNCFNERFGKKLPKKPTPPTSVVLAAAAPLPADSDGAAKPN